MKAEIFVFFSAVFPAPCLTNSNCSIKMLTQWTNLTWTIHFHFLWLNRHIHVKVRVKTAFKFSFCGQTKDTKPEKYLWPELTPGKPEVLKKIPGELTWNRSQPISIKVSLGQISQQEKSICCERWTQNSAFERVAPFPSQPFFQPEKVPTDFSGCPEKNMGASLPIAFLLDSFSDS